MHHSSSAVTVYVRVRHVCTIYIDGTQSVQHVLMHHRSSTAIITNTVHHRVAGGLKLPIYIGQLRFQCIHCTYYNRLRGSDVALEYIIVHIMHCKLYEQFDTHRRHTGHDGTCFTLHCKYIAPLTRRRQWRPSHRLAVNTGHHVHVTMGHRTYYGPRSWVTISRWTTIVWTTMIYGSPSLIGPRAPLHIFHGL